MSISERYCEPEMGPDQSVRARLDLKASREVLGANRNSLSPSPLSHLEVLVVSYH